MKEKSISLLIVIILAITSLSIYAAEDADSLEIKYFYNNPCGSCNVEEEFYELFNKQVGDIKEEINYTVKAYNIFKTSEYEYFQKICDSYGIPKEERYGPVLVIGDSYLVGDEVIGNSLRELFKDQSEKMPKVVIQEEAITTHNDEIGDVPLVEVNPEDSYLVYFYTTSCGDCNKTKKLLGTLEEAYEVKTSDGTIESLVRIDQHSIGESQGTELINTYFKIYNVDEKDQQVPIIFYKEGYLSGYEAIESGLLDVIKVGKALEFEVPNQLQDIAPLTWREFPKLFITGLVNGFNPCSISMLLLLLSLLSVGSPILKLGLTYIIGKAITYLALGTVFYSILATLNATWFQSIQGIINIILVILLLGLAVMNLLDFIAAKQEKYSHIKLQLPTKLRQFNHRMIKKFTEKGQSKYAVIAIFILSIIISAGEFLCTGQIYLATIIYLIKKTSAFSLVTLLGLVIYVVAMILPLMVLILVVYKGQKVLAVSEVVRKNMSTIKLVNSVLFLIFAILIIML